MGVTPCAWEDRIESAAKRAAFDADELDHVRHCVDCRALTAVIELLAEEGRAAERNATQRIPSAGVILARARVARSRADVRKVLQPILWVQRVGVVLTSLALIGAGWWLFMRAQDWLPHDLSGWTGDAHRSLGSVGITAASMLWVAATVLIVASYGLLGLARGRTRSG
jgi:hypothetical protein